VSASQATTLATMEFVKEVSTVDFESGVVDRSRQLPVVVDFWAEWCGPCRVLGPTLERLADEYGGTFELAKLDVDANQALARQFQVQGIPTVIAFRDGHPVARFTGAIPESQIRSWLSGVIPTEADTKAAAGSAAAATGDEATAERLFREALELDPRNEDAACGLAELLVADRRGEEAQALLEPLAPTPRVQRLSARARIASVDTASIDDMEATLASDPDNAELLLRLGRALSAAGRNGDALEVLLHTVALGGESREDARTAMLDIFEILGPSDTLAHQYRRKLASALF
jgi:putative thioredoxin